MANGQTAYLGESAGDGEAVMPLKRGPDGKLGVAGGTGGGGDVSVQIIDQRGSKDAEPVQVQQRSTGNGKRQLTVLVRDTVKGLYADGSFDVDQRTNFGVNRQVSRR